MTQQDPYDGFFKYDKTVATTYEADRLNERHWQKEDEFIRKYLARKKIQRVLDLPVGTGRLFQFYGNVNHLVGIDISEAMLAEARLKQRPTPIGGSTLLQKGDVVDLPFEARYFDMTIVCRLFHLLPIDVLRKAIKELCRVTNTEIVVQSYAKSEPKNRSFSDKMVVVLSKILQALDYKGVAGNSTKAWLHITSYDYQQKVFDDIFYEENFKICSSKVIDLYGVSDVRMTIYKRI